jgi:hypothetical protein
LSNSPGRSGFGSVHVRNQHPRGGEIQQAELVPNSLLLSFFAFRVLGFDCDWLSLQTLCVHVLRTSTEMLIILRSRQSRHSPRASPDSAWSRPLWTDVVVIALYVWAFNCHFSCSLAKGKPAMVKSSGKAQLRVFGYRHTDRFSELGPEMQCRSGCEDALATSGAVICHHLGQS